MKFYFLRHPHFIGKFFIFFLEPQSKFFLKLKQEGIPSRGG
jgi:hypothetical protein